MAGLLVVGLVVVVETPQAPVLLVELAPLSSLAPVSGLEASHWGQPGALSGEARDEIGIVGVVVQLFCPGVIVETIDIILCKIIKLFSLKAVLTQIQIREKDSHLSAIGMQFCNGEKTIDSPLFGDKRKVDRTCEIKERVDRVTFTFSKNVYRV